MNILIKNANVLLADGKVKIADIAIKDSEILAVENIPETFKAEKVIDGTDKLATAGFVNAHTHVSMTLLRSYADDMKLMDWLENKIWPIEAKMKKEDKEYKEITINIIANLLGIGNAATPLGLKAMQTMQEKNPQKDKITDSMAMFIVLNTASIQLIPSTVIAVRASLGSVNPSQIIVPVWIATIAADVAGIVASKILMKKF